MNDNKINAEVLCLGFDEVYKNAWNNRGGDIPNLMYLKPGMAVLDADGALLVRVTETNVETFCDDISLLRIMKGGSGRRLCLSVPTGAFSVVAEAPELPQMTVKLTGVDLVLELSTNARETEISVDDETKTIFARIVSPGSEYSVRILNTLGQEEEQILLTGTTAQEPLCLVQKDSRLYAAGVTEQASLSINGVCAPLTVIGKLVE